MTESRKKTLAEEMQELNDAVAEFAWAVLEPFVGLLKRSGFGVRPWVRRLEERATTATAKRSLPDSDSDRVVVEGE